MEEENAFEEADRVDQILNVLEVNDDLIDDNNDNDDITAPPSGASLMSRSTTFPV